MAVSPLDCMGCTLCVKACPINAKAAKDGTDKVALKMVPQESQLDQQAAFDYAVEKVSEKKELINTTIKGSQFKQPLLEFSGSCAGCAETSYATPRNSAVRRENVYLERNRMLLHLGRLRTRNSLHRQQGNRQGSGMG